MYSGEVFGDRCRVWMTEAVAGLWQCADASVQRCGMNGEGYVSGDECVCTASRGMHE